ncbi:MAG TPA: flagellar basal body L-ring protein FlgH [Fimbriimonadaceae bacterium]|nr:flagellar basal body L-ring protein FlgH [Fimbriimonadaceae bacterium]
MKMFVMGLVFGLVTISVAQDENPGSLWDHKSSSPFRDRVAGREGDVITILVSESSSSSFAAQTTTAKSDQNSITKGLGPILGNLIPALGTGANSTNTGQGSTTQTGRFSARLSAVIKKVLPNGMLVIEGTRNVNVNKDLQTIKISGLIRKDDIRSDNTVLSESIADAFITATGKGAIVDRQRRGILTRVLDWLF